MLILTRKENQSILFPNLGVKVHITKINGKKVSVGIDAPTTIPILRGELEGSLVQGVASPPNSEGISFSHELRNALNKAQLAIALVLRQVELGALDEIESTLSGAIAALDSLDKHDEFRSKESDERVILVVEDDENERELFAGLLETYGYDVRAVEDGVEALHYLENNAAPDLSSWTSTCLAWMVCKRL